MYIDNYQLSNLLKSLDVKYPSGDELPGRARGGQQCAPCKTEGGESKANEERKIKALKKSLREGSKNR